MTSYRRCGVAFGLKTLAIIAALGVSGCQTNAWQGPTPGTQIAAPASVVAANNAASFAVGIVPTQAPPVRIGTPVSFQMASSAAGFGHLYLINASGNVLAMAENLPIAANAPVLYPNPGGGVTLRATPPAGTERVVLLVTRQPFAGFGGTGGATSTQPRMLALTPAAFIEKLNTATSALVRESWAIAEERLQIIN